MIVVNVGDSIHQYILDSSLSEKMSAIVATEMVEGAFERARNAVLRCSDRINERVFEGISLRDLTVAECKSLILTINARLSKSDMRCWSTTTASGSLYRGKSILVCCFNTDQSAHKTYFMNDRTLFK